MRSKTKQARKIGLAAGAFALSLGIAAGAVAQPPLRSGWNLAERVATLQAYAEDNVTLPQGYAVDWHGYAGNQTTSYQNGNVYYVNYEFAAAKCTDNSGTLVYEHKYGYNFDAAGVATKVDFEALYTKQRTDIQEDISSSVVDAATVADKFKAGYKEAYDANQIPGYTATGVRLFNANVIQDCWRGVSNRDEAGIMRAYLVYNKSQDAVHAVTYSAYEWIENSAGLKAPIGLFGAHTFKVDGIEVTLEESQMFMGGYVYRDQGVMKTVLKEYNGSGYGQEEQGITPPVDYAPPDVGHNFFGPASAPTAYTSVHKIEDVYYVNYPYGYVTCTAAKPYTYAYYYGRNVNESGAASTVADLDGVTNTQRNDIEGSLGSLVADDATVQAKFKAGYKSSLAAGKYLGYSASGIRVHQDITVLQNFWHGDGTNGGNQEAYLVYNKGLDNPYAVTKFSAYWVERHGELGAPRGLEGEHTFKVNGVEKTYADVQMFDKGFIYRENGEIKHTTLAYNADNNNYGTMPETPEEVTLPANYAVNWHDFEGTQGIIYKTGNVYYVNYQFGYVKCTDNAGVLSYVYRYGRNANASGAETKVEFEALFAKQKTNAESDNVASLVVDVATLPAKFKAGYKEAYDANQIPGYSSTGFYVFDGIVIQDFWRGDGNRIEAASPDITRAYLVYNKAQDAAHAVTAFSEEWIANHSNLGAPVGVYGAQSFKVKGVATQYAECQLFTGGYIYRDGSTVKVEYAAYDAEHNNYGEMPTIINPPDAWAGYYGAQDANYIKSGNVTYINYANGYVKCTETPSKTVYDYFYGRNIDAAGKVTPTDVTRAANTMNFTVQNGVDLTGYVKDLSTVTQKFREGWIASYNAGQIPGVTPGQIYIFNGTVIQNYWHGMGNANAMKEGYLTYNKAADATYYVGRYASTWLSLANNFKSARTAMGTQTFKVNGKDVTYQECQLFEGGYIYTDGDQFKTVLAFYDALNGTYIETKVPANFGAMTADPIVNGDETYYNFEHGAVKAVKGANGNVYTNHPARNFDAAGVLTMQNIDYYLDMLRGVNIVGNFSPEERADILNALIAKYTEQFNAGFFPGFPDSDVQMWDGIYGLQCFIGDSTGNPFSSYDARSNVLIFSVDLSTFKVTILKDDMLVLWSKLRIAPAFEVVLGAPTGEMKTDGDTVYQQFGSNTLICLKHNIETWVVTTKTYEEWKAEQAANGKNKAKGCNSSLAGGSAVAGIGGLIAAALMLNRKKRGGKDA